MTLTRKFMLDTLLVFSTLEQLAELTDRELYVLYCERMGHEDTQESCKERFLVALHVLTQTLDAIDDDTPAKPGTGQDIEPKWWVDMMQLARDARKLHDKYK